MRGYIEIKEDSYEDTVEQLHKIKAMACKLIKTLSEQTEDRDYEDEEYNRGMYKNRGRYNY